MTTASPAPARLIHGVSLEVTPGTATRAVVERLAAPVRAGHTPPVVVVVTARPEVVVDHLAAALDAAGILLRVTRSCGHEEAKASAGGTVMVLRPEQAPHRTLGARFEEMFVETGEQPAALLWGLMARARINRAGVVAVDAAGDWS